jgi:hypothetical protein
MNSDDQLTDPHTICARAGCHWSLLTVPLVLQTVTVTVTVAALCMNIVNTALVPSTPSDMDSLTLKKNILPPSSGSKKRWKQVAS